MENNSAASSSSSALNVNGGPMVAGDLKRAAVDQAENGKAAGAKRAKTCSSSEEDVKRALKGHGGTTQAPGGQIIPIVSLPTQYLAYIDHARLDNKELMIHGDTLPSEDAGCVYRNELRHRSYQQFLELVLDRLGELGIERLGFDRQHPCPITFYRRIQGNGFIQLKVRDHVFTHWLAMGRFWELAREEMDLIGYHLIADEE
ncbi:unnamed protein product [Linum trigynum]|uniref:Uncharacterized protein n=1 Tax=Linum trigynum TaxID=586398 RepID=A0AAV2F5Z1_9ROSI